MKLPFANKVLSPCRRSQGLALFLLLPLLASASPHETVGPSSRRTPLVISEIMYHPSTDFGDGNGEFIELYNSQPWPADISGYRIEGGVTFEFPPSTVIAPKDYVVIAKSPSTATTIYGIQNPLGPFQGSLNNQGETLRLLNQSRAVLLQVSYDNRLPWPLEGAGTGHSIVLASPSRGESNPRAWTHSARFGGSPGTDDTPFDSPLHQIRINEISWHPGHPETGFVEIVNRGSESAAIGGATILVHPQGSRYQFPAQSTLKPGEIRTVTTRESSLKISPRDEWVSLTAPHSDFSIASFPLTPHEPNHSLGPTTDRSVHPPLLSAPTPNQPNAEAKRARVIFNEIMFHPSGGGTSGEYIELYNRTDQPIDLVDWQIDGDIRFTFPSQTSIPAGAYLVVAKDAAFLRQIHSHLNASNSTGDFRGSLSNRGGRLTLLQPIPWRTTGDSTELLESMAHQVEDSIEFQDRTRWSRWADGGGSSLELKNPASDNDYPANWADSDETQKASWESIQFTGPLDRSAGTRPRSLQILLMGEGECLVDNVELFKPEAPNQVTNSAFDTNPNVWVPQGNHVQSHIVDHEGPDSSPALKIVTTGRGDPHTNRIRTTLARGDLIAPGDASLKAQVRWLRGHPEILFRLQSNFAESFHRMTVPRNLGTPGQRNSRWEPNPAPVIQGVQHAPVLPSAEDSIVVTATIHDNEGIGSAQLNYKRDDSSSEWQALEMNDLGLAGDQMAGDNLYTAVIPPQDHRTLLLFNVQAGDLAPTPRVGRFPSAAQGQQCLVRIGDAEASEALGAYRLWVSRDTVSAWRSSRRPTTSNEPLDATFVYNNDRVIYNVGAYYSGSFFNSPNYTGPTGSPCDYAIRFPNDDRFLGSEKIIISWPGLTGSPDSTLQREQFSYWLADQLGLPFNYRRYVTVLVNGIKRNTVMEDTQRPNQDMLHQWFPGAPDGDLFKIQLRYESNDAANSIAAGLNHASLERVTHPDGTINTSAYRWNWAPRSDDLTANRFEPLYDLINAVNQSDPTHYLSQVDDLVDMEQWMRTFAVEHIVGNWDSYGYGNGQNMYAYKPQTGKWQLMIWDLDIGNGTGESSRTPLFKLTNPFFPNVNGDAQIVRRMYQTPAFVRAYWRAVEDAVQGPMTDARVEGFLSTRFEALREIIGGRRPSSPSSISRYISQRRNYIIDQLARLETPFQVTSPEADQISTDQPTVRIRGTAPIQVTSIRINGSEHQPHWTDTTEWEMNVALRDRTNQIILEAFDLRGLPILPEPLTVAIDYTGDRANLPPKIVINEWMALNQSVIADPSDGDFDDWIELHNREPHPVLLAGYTLTDNLERPKKWAFPKGSEIPADGLLLLWADGETAAPSPDGSLHVSFRLNAEGEQLALFDPMGRLIDFIEFPEQAADISMGRSLQDPGGAPVVLAESSPGSINSLPHTSPSPPPLIELQISLVDSAALLLEWDATTPHPLKLQTRSALGRATPWVNVILPTEENQLRIPLDHPILSASNQAYFRLVRVQDADE